MGGSKKKSTTSTNTLDAPTTAQQGDIYAASQAAANAPGVGVDQATMDALAGDKQLSAYGNQGLLALNGDPTAAAKFANPNAQGILDNINTNEGYASQAATNATNQSATRAGAFGGSRAAVAQGTAQAGVAADALNQKNSFQYQNANDQFQREQSAANMGFGANQAQAGIGQYIQQINQQNDPATRRLMMLKLGVQGTPYGSTQTNTQYQPWSSAIGGGLLQAGGIAAMAGG